MLLRRMGRKKLWHDRLHLTLPEGAKERIDAVLREDEDRLDFIRTAIDAEAERRGGLPPIGERQPEGS